MYDSLIDAVAAAEAQQISLGELALRTEAAEGLLLEILMGKRHCSELISHASVFLVKPAVTVSGWRRWLSNPTPYDFLKHNTSLSKDQIKDILEKHGLDHYLSLNRLAGTPRLLLGLEKAYAQGAEVVIFSTPGLDSIGIQKVFRTVEEHLPACSAIYIAKPFICQNEETYIQMPGASQITISNHSRVFV